MESKLEANSYSTLDQFVYDARLIFNNCRSYNDNQSNCKSFPISTLPLFLVRGLMNARVNVVDVKNANKLETYLNEQLKVYSDP